jgi:hypothetical protein
VAFPNLQSVNTTPLLVKGSKTRLVGYHIFNPGTAAAFLQLFDVAAVASVTLGSTVPVMSLGVPAGGAVFVPANDASVSWDFFSGIVMAASATYNGSGAPNASLIVNLAYM